MIFILFHQRAVVMHVVFTTLRIYAIPLDALNEVDLEWLGYNLVKVA